MVNSIQESLCGSVTSFYLAGATFCDDHVNPLHIVCNSVSLPGKKSYTHQHHYLIHGLLIIAIIMKSSMQCRTSHAAECFPGCVYMIYAVVATAPSVYITCTSLQMSQQPQTHASKARGIDHALCEFIAPP